MSDPSSQDPARPEDANAEPRIARPARARGARGRGPAPESAPPAGTTAAVPGDFVTETEHPLLPIPFSAQLGEVRLDGTALSVTAAHVVAPGGGMELLGRRSVATLRFEFAGFTVSLAPEVTVGPSRRPGELVLQFVDPLGPHLPQLRHIVNSYIAGDLVSLGGLLSYAGPTAPRGAAKTAEGPGLRQRLRSMAVALVSVALILTAAGLLLGRAAQTVEARPVFVERESRELRATVAGQIAYLNPAAMAGEVVFSINSNTGDVLNFRLPCDCQVEVTEGIFEGATVLPEDKILSAFESISGITVQTQISIEGLARVMDGDRAILDLADGRSLSVDVQSTSATAAAMDRGDLFVPVTLVPAAGALGPDDVGLGGRLRLAAPWMPRIPFSPGEDP